MKTKIFLAFLIIAGITSCTTVKKAISHEVKTADSVRSTVHDTTSKKVDVTKQSDLQLSDFNIDIVYSDKDTAKAADVFDQPQIQALHDVVKSVSGNRVPGRISIHIGSLSDSGQTVTHLDIISSHTGDSTAIHKTDDTSTKNVEIKRSPLWLTFAAIGLGILLLLFIIYKIKQKFLL